MIFGHGSAFYGVREEVRKHIASKLDLIGTDLAQVLRSPPPPEPVSEDLETESLTRLTAFKILVEEHNARPVLLVPPLRKNIPLDAVQRAGEKAGVKILCPIEPGKLPDNLYSDGFHLNDDGADLFIRALGETLKRL